VQHGQPISRCLGPDVHIHFIYLTFHTSLLPLVFILFLIIAIQLSYGHSKMVIEFDGSDRSRILEIQAVNQQTSSGKPQNKSSRIGAAKVFTSSPGAVESSEEPPFGDAGEVSGQCQNEVLAAFVGCQGGFLIPRSSLRPFSGRVAHRPGRPRCVHVEDGS
jgi:hypothetical protein